MTLDSACSNNVATLSFNVTAGVLFRCHDFGIDVATLHVVFEF